MAGTRALPSFVRRSFSLQVEWLEDRRVLSGLLFQVGAVGLPSFPATSQDNSAPSASTNPAAQGAPSSLASAGTPGPSQSAGVTVGLAPTQTAVAATDQGVLNGGSTESASSASLTGTSAAIESAFAPTNSAVVSDSSPVPSSTINLPRADQLTDSGRTSDASRSESKDQRADNLQAVYQEEYFWAARSNDRLAGDWSPNDLMATAGNHATSRPTDDSLLLTEAGAAKADIGPRDYSTTSRATRPGGWVSSQQHETFSDGAFSYARLFGGTERNTTLAVPVNAPDELAAFTPEPTPLSLGLDQLLEQAQSLGSDLAASVANAGLAPWLVSAAAAGVAAALAHRIRRRHPRLRLVGTDADTLTLLPGSFPLEES
jgi:hypothetical protein